MKHDSGTATAGAGAPRRKSILALIASFAMLCIGLVGIIAAPGASAHTPTISLTCGSGLKVDLTNYVSNQQHPNQNSVSITIDGAAVGGTPANFGTEFHFASGQLDQFTSHTAHVTVDAWDNSGEVNQDYNLGACKTKYTADKTVNGTLTICYPGDGNGNTIVVNWSGTGHGESTVSQAAANQAALDAANANALTDKNTKLAQYAGYKEGSCSNTYTAVAVTVSKTICVDGVTQTVQVTGSAITVGPQNTPITQDQKNTANAAAQQSAQDALTAELAKPKYNGWKDGKCANTYSVTKTAEADACVEGSVQHFTAESTVNLPAQEQPFTDKQKSDAAALAQSQANDALTDKISKAGGVRGQCTATAQHSGEITICADSTQQEQARALETITVNWSTAVFTGHGATTADAQADADAQAKAAEAAAKAAALAPYGDFTDGACKDSTTYGASRGVTGSTTICTKDGQTVQVNWSGSGSAAGKATQGEANTQAQNDAQKAADADKAAKLAGFPGATEGACVPPTTTSPVVAPAPATVPAPAKVPTKKPVAAPQPGSVPAGYAGTVPAAVPAGGGSSAPQSGLPGWAILLMVAGAAGAAFSVKRLASQR